MLDTVRASGTHETQSYLAYSMCMTLLTGLLVDNPVRLEGESECSIPLPVVCRIVHAGACCMQRCHREPLHFLRGLWNQRCLLTAGLTLVEATARRYGARLLARMPNMPFFTIAKTIAGTVGRTTRPATNLSSTASGASG